LPREACPSPAEMTNFWALSGLVLLFALSYYVGYVFLYLYFYLATASKDSPRRGGIARRLFPSVAKHVDTDRRSLGPEALKETAPRLQQGARAFWRLAALLLTGLAGVVLLVWVGLRYFGLVS
jgi:hypothetical protein